MRLASSSESHARSCRGGILGLIGSLGSGGGQCHNGHGPFLAFKAVSGRQVGAALGIGDCSLQRQTVSAQQPHFCALHGLARAKVLHKYRAGSVASLFNGKAHICNQQHARGSGNGLVALVTSKLYAHESVHWLLAAAQQGGQIKHGKGRGSGLFLAHLYAALNHIAHNVHF